MIAEQIQKYGNGDWVTENIGTNIYDKEQSHNSTIISSNRKKQWPKLHCCGPQEPTKCKLHKGDPKHGHGWIDVRVGYVLAFIAVLMYKGALQLWTVSLFWKKGLGANFPVVQNTITRDAYIQMQCFIHLINK